jgi:hypothetical protein
MAFADFCAVTPDVAAGRAARRTVSRCRFLRSGRAARPGAWLLVSRSNHPGLAHDTARRTRRRSPQVRTRTVGAQAPHLPWRPYRWALLSCASSPRPPGPCMRFLSVASHLLHSGFLRTNPRGPALAVGSWLSLLTMSPSRYSHRGLPPHKFAPMLGAHHSINRTNAGWLRHPPFAGYVKR